MCGIAGIIAVDSRDLKTALEKMSGAIAHRGPDHSGIYAGQLAGLAHRRFSVAGLSGQANQPMYSPDGRYVLAYNGEVYNAGELKGELNAYPYRTKSDAEVIIAAFTKWGVGSFARFNGMFAFGLWDTVENVLYLVRDKSGIIPVYYAQGKDHFLFSSELRSLLASGYVPHKLDRERVLEYFQYQTVHAPRTLVEGVHMPEAGHYLKVKTAPALGVENICYGSFRNVLGANIIRKDEKEVRQDVCRLLQKSVERRMVADVPMGAFLSGGIDSSVLVGLMAQLSNEPVNTFNISFDESKYNEAHFAKIVARKFKTNHTEIRLQPKDFLNSLPCALAATDHPSGDGPNTWVISHEVRKRGIKVAFSGLGGDELFAGYAHFKRALVYDRYAAWAHMPRWLKNTAGYALKKTKRSVSANKFAEVLARDSWDMAHTYPIGRRMFLDAELSGLLNLNTDNDRVAAICADIPRHRELVLSQVTLAEFETYMQHVLLRDTDQMAMAIPVEGRLPFLDTELIEYVLNIPDALKNPLTPKKLLVESVGDLLPPEIVNRPKMGFVLPWDVWMKNELLDFCRQHITGLSCRDFIKAERLLKYWQQFLAGDRTITWSRIWYMVVLEYWLERYGID
jgi:asparagine synthase (glutamine-hydrolysing)